MKEPPITSRHPREGGDPWRAAFWIPAYAGMTGRIFGRTPGLLISGRELAS